MCGLAKGAPLYPLVATAMLLASSLFEPAREASPCEEPAKKEVQRETDYKGELIYCCSTAKMQLRKNCTLEATESSYATLENFKCLTAIFKITFLCGRIKNLKDVIMLVLQSSGVENSRLTRQFDRIFKSPPKEIHEAI